MFRAFLCKVCVCEYSLRMFRTLRTLSVCAALFGWLVSSLPAHASLPSTVEWNSSSFTDQGGWYSGTLAGITMYVDPDSAYNGAVATASIQETSYFSSVDNGTNVSGTGIEFTNGVTFSFQQELNYPLLAIEGLGQNFDTDKLFIHDGTGSRIRSEILENSGDGELLVQINVGSFYNFGVANYAGGTARVKVGLDTDPSVNPNATPTSVVIDAGSSTIQQMDPAFSDGTPVSIGISLVDTNGRPVTGASLSVSTDLGTASSVTDNGDGTYQFTVSSTADGDANLSIEANGTALQAVTISFSPRIEWSLSATSLDENVNQLTSPQLQITSNVALPQALSLESWIVDHPTSSYSIT